MWQGLTAVRLLHIVSENWNPGTAESRQDSRDFYLKPPDQHGIILEAYATVSGSSPRWARITRSLTPSSFCSRRARLRPWLAGEATQSICLSRGAPKMQVS